MTEKQKQAIKTMALKRVVEACGTDAGNTYIDNIKLVGIMVIADYTIMDFIDESEDFKGQIAFSLI